MKKLILFLLSIATTPAAAGTFNDSVTANYFGFKTQGSAPSTPASGYVDCYVLSSDGKLYCKNSSGTASAYSTYADPLTTLGDIVYENSTPAAARLAGNTSATRKFLAQTGTGTVSAAPVWSTIANSDIPAPDGSGGLGGVVADSCLAHQFTTGVVTNTGHLSCSQPAFSDISGTATSSQIPADVVYNDVAATFSVAGYLFSHNATSGTPVLKLNGFPYVAGTSTTNKPLLDIDNGTSSSGWSTAGTYFGVNGNSAFLGNLLDLQLNDTSVFSVNYQGIATGNGSGLTNLNASNVSTGSLALGRIASIANNTVLSNVSGSSGAPSANTLTAILDSISSTQGTILYRGATGWSALTPGTSGKFLETLGASTDPTWAEPASTPHYAQVYTGSNLTPGANGVVKWDGIINNPDSSYSATTGLYTAPVTGNYLVTSVIQLTTSVTGVYAQVNGTGGFYMGQASGSALPQSVVVHMTAGDTVGIYFDTGSRTISANAGATPYLANASFTLIN